MDSAGVPVVMLSGNGASARSQGAAQLKAFVAAVLAMDSREAFDRAKTDASFAEKVKADPRMLALPGGMLLRVGGAPIGALAVSGAPGPGVDTAAGRDEACAKAGVQQVAPRLKRAGDRGRKD